MLICAGAPPALAHGELGYYTWMDIEAASRAIVEKAPPASSVVVSLGRSPAAVAAMLEARHPGYVHELPLSGFREQILDAPEKALLFAHFRRMLPPAASLAGKEVVLLDAAMTGNSAIAVTIHLREFLAEYAPTAKLRTVVMMAMPTKSGAQKMISAMAKQGGVEVEAMEVGENLRVDFKQQRFDHLARYQSFHLGKDSAPILNPGHQKLQKDLRQWIDIRAKKFSDPAQECAAWSLWRGISPAH